MLLPKIAPSQPYPLDALLRDLDQLVINLNNSVTSGSAVEVLANYQYWANEAAARLTHVFSHDDVARLVLTPRHWVLMSMTGAENERALHATLRAERLDRSKALTAVEDQLRLIEQAWRGVTAAVVAPDTNIYLHRKEKFWDIDWLAVAGAAEVRLLVPMTVFRELDIAKRAPGNKKVLYEGDELVRDRARVTSRDLRQRLPKPESIGKVSEGVTVELVLDAPGHRPIDDGDSEIIDRLAAAQRLLGHKISVCTDDGNMEYGARVAGLGAIRWPS